jgi:hypothetical protein
MTWPIESGIPIPRKKSGEDAKKTGLAEALRSLEVGQSVHIENLNRSSVCGTTSSVSRSWGGKFVTRSTETGIRIWRVE